MKRTIVFVSFLLFLIFSCHTYKKSKIETNIYEYEVVADNGLELIAKSDCVICHKIDEKYIGPAWRVVANKYDSTFKSIDLLAKKIITGGGGVWGNIPMAPHSKISRQDALAMAKYILLVEK